MRGRPPKDASSLPPPPQPRRHNDTADFSKGPVQVDDPGVGPGFQGIEKGKILAAQDSRHPLLLQKAEEGILIGGVLGFQIPHLVHKGPGAGAFHASVQRPHPRLSKGPGYRAHAVFRAGEGRIKDPYPGYPAGGNLHQVDPLPTDGTGADAGDRGRAEQGQQFF